MTERDAFGNPIGEDTLAGLRPEPTSEPTPLNVPGTAPRADSDVVLVGGAEDLRSPGERGRRRGGGGLAGVLAVAVVVASGAALAVVGGSGDDAERAGGVAAVLPGGDSSEGPAAPDRARRPSLLSARGFAGALRRAGAASPGGRLKLVRLAAERMDAQYAGRDGGLDLVQIGADGARRVIHAPSSGTGGTPALKVAAIDTRAPRRLIRSAAERLGRRTSSVDYLVLLDAGGGPRWSVYFKGGRAFLADAHGRITQKIQ